MFGLEIEELVAHQHSSSSSLSLSSHSPPLRSSVPGRLPVIPGSPQDTMERKSEMVSGVSVFMHVCVFVFCHIVTVCGCVGWV